MTGINFPLGNGYLPVRLSVCGIEQCPAERVPDGFFYNRVKDYVLETLLLLPCVPVQSGKIKNVVD
jgi:hypothetical protein